MVKLKGETLKVKVTNEIEVCHDELADDILGPYNPDINEAPHCSCLNLDDMIIIPKGSIGILSKNESTGYYQFEFISGVYEDGDDADGEEIFMEGIYRLPFDDDEFENYLIEVKE